MDIALSLTGIAFLFFWLATKDNIRENHEALGVLFFFLGFAVVIVDTLSLAQEARALTYYGIEDMMVVLTQVFALAFVFVLFYFMLKYASGIFSMFSKALNHPGRDNEE